jgi:pimeloyl-ACP methyl ester carboxylesterase
MRQIAEQGYMVVLVKMPLSLAVFGVDKADAVIAAYSDILYWTIGGHSLGGSMAANYANKHLDKINGVVFWASYPAGSDDLSKTELKGLSVYGSNDTVLDSEVIESTKPLLPPGTIIEEIPGGTHAQFGNYGLQPGDGKAEISTDAQQALTAALTIRLLRAVEGE